MQNKKGFTLVELIVVITILAILWTIAFISLQWYSSESRDSKRISDLWQIRTGLSIEQAREWTVPMPDEAISVWSGSTTYTHQWYAGTWVLNSLRVSEAKDPSDDKYYTYTTNSNQTGFQLVSMLENWETAYNNILPQTYADYEDRIAYTIWDPLGTLLEWTTKIPVHQLESITDDKIDLSTDTTTEYIPVFTRWDNTTSSWAELVTKLSSLEYVWWKTYSKWETFKYDGLFWHVSTNTNVAYTKSSWTNDIPADLKKSDNILVFDNWTLSLVKWITAFVLRTVNEWATIPYIYGIDYNSWQWNWTELWSDSSSRKISYEADDEMLWDYYQWWRNDPVSLLETSETLYGWWYMTWWINLSSWSWFIKSSNSTNDTWITDNEHEKTMSVTWTDNDNSWLCSTGYHVPSTSSNEWSWEWRVVTELVTGVTSSWSESERQELQKYLLIPMAGYRYYSNWVYLKQGSNGLYWSSRGGHYLIFYSMGINPNSTNSNRAYGFSVRCFKN